MPHLNLLLFINPSPKSPQERRVRAELRLRHKPDSFTQLLISCVVTRLSSSSEQIKRSGCLMLEASTLVGGEEKLEIINRLS